MRKVLSHDAATGITRFFHWDDTKDDFIIQTRQECEPIVDANKASFNEAPARWGDLDRIASIPVSVFFDLRKRGITDDPKAFRRWLNDPDNRFFRVRPGVV